MATLVLAFPGTGVRRASKSEGFTHLDKYGKFDGSYFKWIVPPDDLHHVMKTQDTLIGWARNWPELLELPWDAVFYWAPLSPEEYQKEVEKYRAAPEYKEVDLPLLQKYGETDWPVPRHTEAYRQWRQEMKASGVRETFLGNGRHTN